MKKGQGQGRALRYLKALIAISIGVIIYFKKQSRRKNEKIKKIIMLKRTEMFLLIFGYLKESFVKENIHFF